MLRTLLPHAAMSTTLLLAVVLILPLGGTAALVWWLRSRRRAPAASRHLRHTGYRLAPATPKRRGRHPANRAGRTGAPRRTRTPDETT